MRPPPGVATLVEREDVTPTLAIFRFTPEGRLGEFAAGQYVTLGIDDPEGEAPTVWRAYSLCNPPEERERIELYVRWARRPVPGELTTRLWALAPGARVRWRGPKGHFTLAETRADGSPDERPLVLLGSGTGIAPFVAYARHLAHVRSRRRVVVGHGVSYRRELAFAGLFAELARGDAVDLAWLPTVSRPSAPENAGWSGAVGRVETLLPEAGAEPGVAAVERALAEPFAPGAVVVHVCGFEETLAAVLARLQGLGFRGARDPRPDGTFDVRSESFGRDPHAGPALAPRGSQRG